MSYAKLKTRDFLDVLETSIFYYFAFLTMTSIYSTFHMRTCLKHFGNEKDQDTVGFEDF